MVLALSRWPRFALGIKTMAFLFLLED